MNIPPVIALEFYSGIGGLHHALKKSNPDARVLRAFDWDPTSCQVYSANFAGLTVARRDISTITAAELADLDANLWLMSPACQPYTVLNPEAKGAADPRAQSFLHLIQNVLPELARTEQHPSYLLVENVAGFETSSTRQVLLNDLQSLGYHTLELLLTPLQYGIPNSRLRYYLLARKQPMPEGDQVWRHIPGQPAESRLEVSPLKHYLDVQPGESSRVPDSILQKWGRLFDIVLPSSRRSCCFTRGYTHLVERSGSVLQETEALDTTQVFDLFLQAKSDGKDDAVDTLRPLCLRYFTAAELLRIFAFDEDVFVWPDGISSKTKYRLIGNTVNVRVVQELITYLLRADTVPFLCPLSNDCQFKQRALDINDRPPDGARGSNEGFVGCCSPGATYDDIKIAYVGHCYGDSTSGQRALYNLGLTHIPIVNVNNNCSTGSSALYQANNAVKYGQVGCGLALGFERMNPGSLGTNFPDRPSPLILVNQRSEELEADLGHNHGPGAPRIFDNGAQEYFVKHGGGVEHLAKIASKNHKHSVNNPYSQFQNGWSEEQILSSPKITKNLTKFMCSPTSDGAAACIVASEDFVHRHGLENQAIEIIAQALTTDGTSTFEGQSAMDVAGYEMSKICADQVFSDAGFAPGQGRDLVGVVELHDCFASNELITYLALGLCQENEAHKLVERGDNTYGGKYVINPSGGLEAKGHPLGATGLGMHFYIMMQLRNWAGPMQAPGLFDIPDKRGKYGLVHNVGLGGAVVVSLLRRPDFYKEGGKDGRDRLGYNHAHECRPVTSADVDKVKSTTASSYVLRHARL